MMSIIKNEGIAISTVKKLEIGLSEEKILSLIKTSLNDGLKAWNDRIPELLNTFADEIDKKIREIDESKRNDNVNVRNIMQAVDNAKWCIEEAEVRRMFANLIAAEHNTDKVTSLASSFPDIIRQLSREDAIILNLFSDKAYFGTIPMISVRDVFSMSGSYYLRGYVRLSSEAQQKELEKKILFVEDSLANFERLGLIKVADSMVAGVSEFDRDCEWLERNITKINEYKEFSEMARGSGAFSIFRESFSYTPFGLNFVRSCVL